MDGPSQSSGTSVFQIYAIRVQLALVLTLSLLLVAVNIPTSSSPDRVGWSSKSSLRPPEHVTMSEVQTESSSETAFDEQLEEAPPPTDVAANPTEPTVASSEVDQQEPEPTEEDTASASPYSDVQSVSTLTAQDEQPQLVGGLGSLYLHIEYPDEARKQRIEGQLELEFTVGRNGEVNNIQVVNSLHPLCDSAAVKGVRSVQFVPAKHNGAPIPVRMRLPVRFRLVQMANSPETAGLEQ